METITNFIQANGEIIFKIFSIIILAVEVTQLVKLLVIKKVVKDEFYKIFNTEYERIKKRIIDVKNFFNMLQKEHKKKLELLDFTMDIAILKKLKISRKILVWNIFSIVNLISFGLIVISNFIPVLLSGILLLIFNILELYDAIQIYKHTQQEFKNHLTGKIDDFKLEKEKLTINL